MVAKEVLIYEQKRLNILCLLSFKVGKFSCAFVVLYCQADYSIWKILICFQSIEGNVFWEGGFWTGGSSRTFYEQDEDSSHPFLLCLQYNAYMLHR